MDDGGEDEQVEHVPPGLLRFLQTNVRMNGSPCFGALNGSIYIYYILCVCAWCAFLECHFFINLSHARHALMQPFCSTVFQAIFYMIPLQSIWEPSEGALSAEVRLPKTFPKYGSRNVSDGLRQIRSRGRIHSFNPEIVLTLEILRSSWSRCHKTRTYQRPFARQVAKFDRLPLFHLFGDRTPQEPNM